jgi:hypothetical protein
MRLSRAAFRLQLTGDATPQLPGVSGPVALGMRLVQTFEAAADLPDEFGIFSVGFSGITGGTEPVVTFGQAIYAADGATVTGNASGKDFEGLDLEMDAVRVIVIEVTGALVTASIAGTGVIARLPVGTHVFSAAHLAEWAGAVTFSAPAGTAAVNLVMLTQID